MHLEKAFDGIHLTKGLYMVINCDFFENIEENTLCS